MRRRSAALALTLLVTFAAGCAKADKAVSKDLEEDLRQAEVTTVEMAPTNRNPLDLAQEFPGGQGKSPSRKAVGVTTVGGPNDSSVMALTTSPDGKFYPKLDTTSMSRRPRPVESPTPTRSGPYKSTSEVIRDAPFPIKP